jgi:3-oxoacyl-(acyl-carrier-protein) synthase/NAD(P)-dependent dehydrogenase (short-subunit alcohol dehydrogenase family)
MDITARLALAAGIEALKDAGIPLVRQTRTTSTGGQLPDSWALPAPLRQDTGVIFASAFPGLASLVEEVSSETASRFDVGARKRLIEFYTGLVSRVQDDNQRDEITKWFAAEVAHLNPSQSEELYSFNRSFLMRVLSLASGQLAQFIKAQGPNTHLDAACASTTQAILTARDWIRSGQAKRVLVVAADDVAGRTLLPWIGSGFLAMGAATIHGSVGEAALPFDDRRAGLVLGSAAVGLLLERDDVVKERGMEGIASVEAGAAANSAYHGTRLDVDHIAGLMDRMIARWEEQSGKSRRELAADMFFMSHETYSPKRGGSAAAEVRALRETFGDRVKLIPIANTKGFTGHTMGAGVEDVVAVRCLQRTMLPPIANLKQPDPEFADLNLSRGGRCQANYALRLAAGFGSQIVMALYKAVSKQENRIVDLMTHRNWLKQITGYSDPVVSVENRTLRVSERLATVDAAKDAQEAGLVDAPAKSVAAPSPEKIRGKILTILAAKTGYPPDMLDTGLDLEADLGIDTVKQAEFIAEVREAFGIPRIEGLKIADFPTINHIIEFVQTQTTDAAPRSAADAAAGTSTQPATGQVEDEIRGKILQLLSKKTGYPEEMLDIDLDLEADLGVDTVKQAEFIAEVREVFNIPRIDGLKIADFPTIRRIIRFVVEKSAPAKPASEELTEKLEEPTPKQVEHLDAEEDVRLYETRLTPLRDPAPLPHVDAEKVLIFGGSRQLCDALEKEFISRGCASVERIAQPALPEGLQTKQVGVVNLFGAGLETEGINATFELYLGCARVWEQGPAFLIASVIEDGAFGFEDPAVNSEAAGAVAGATKAFAREFPNCRTRVIDVHPTTRAQPWASLLADSIEKDFPVETAMSRDSTLRAIRLVPFVERAAEKAVNPEEVVLVTGGGRGITAECILRIAQGNRLTLILLGRTSLSERAEALAEFGPEEWEAEKTKIIERIKKQRKAPTPVAVDRELSSLQAEAELCQILGKLKATGSEVIYRAVDVRDAGQVDRALQEAGELCGRVDVVVHAAGVEVSRALRGKFMGEIQAVYSVKVQGMANILKGLEKHGLHPRRVVAFGSVAGRFGNMAQVDYSAANDALAHMARRAGKDINAAFSTIDWAPWSEIGMASKGSVQKSLQAAGIDFIQPEAGARLFEQELSRRTGACEVVAAGRLGPFASDAFDLTESGVNPELRLVGGPLRVIALGPRCR